MTPDDVRACPCVQGLKNRCRVDAGSFFVSVYQLFMLSIFIYKCRFFNEFTVQYFRPSGIYMGESFQ